MSNSVDTSSVASAEAVSLASIDYIPGVIALGGSGTRALWVGGAGDVKVDLIGNGTGITFTGLTVGWHPIQAKKIYKTGTTATNLVACW